MLHSRTVRSVAALALLVGVGTAGCTDPAAKPKPLPAPSSPSTSVAGSPTSSPSPSPPTLPAEAHDGTPKGATVFARHYVSQINYAMHTGNTAPLRHLSRKTCSTCQVIANGIDRIYGKGGRLEGSGWRIRTVSTALSTDNQKALVTMQVQITRQLAYADETAAPTVSKPNRGRLDVSLGRQTSGWLVQRLDAVE